MLIKLSEYRQKYLPHIKQPAVVARAKAGKIPGAFKEEGGLWVVDTEAANEPKPKLSPKAQAIFDRVMKNKERRE